MNVSRIFQPFQTHQYQVQEANNDQTFRNSFTGQTNYYAPDNDPSLRTQSLRPVDDPLSVPSNGKPKPVDVQFHQNLDNYGASALVQEPQYSIDPFGFPVTSQPQLQQYHLQQNTMLRQGMPLASLNPTYLVVQSNNLLNQHQQHLTPNLFRPENGFVDTSVTSQPSFVTSQPSFVTYNSYDYSGPQEVASLGQILSAQRDALEQQYEVSSTQAPSTISNYVHHDGQASQNNPTYSQVPDPKPSNYQYSQQNFVDLPDERLTQHDIQNLLNYNGLYQDYINHRQLENDLILREAQEKLQNKLSIQHQQQQTAYDLHQLVQQEKYNPLRIVVPDEDQEVNYFFPSLNLIVSHLSVYSNSREDRVMTKIHTMTMKKLTTVRMRMIQVQKQRRKGRSSKSLRNKCYLCFFKSPEDNLDIIYQNSCSFNSRIKLKLRVINTVLS